MAALPFTPLAIGAACYFAMKGKKRQQIHTAQEQDCGCAPTPADRIKKVVSGGDRVAIDTGSPVMLPTRARRVFAGASRVCRLG